METQPTDDSQQTSTDGRQTVDTSTDRRQTTDTGNVSTDGQPAVVWMSRKAASIELDCSERTVDRRVEAGKLQRRWGENGAVEIGVPSSASMSTDGRLPTDSGQTTTPEHLSTDSDVSIDGQTSTDRRQTVDTDQMSTDGRLPADTRWRDDLRAQVARLEANEDHLRADVDASGRREELSKARIVDLERAATVREGRIVDMEATHADALATRDADLAELRGQVSNLEVELRESHSRAEANALGWATRADELSHRIADLVDKHQHANERVYELEPEAERVPILVADIEDRDATLDAIASRVPAPVFRYLKRGKWRR